MIDAPHGADMLDAVARLLRDTLIPQLPADTVFQARVAANAVDLVAREIRLSAAAQTDATLRLKALLSLDASLPALEIELAKRIREGQVGADTPGLMDHLWATTLAKMAIDQPSYASYKREIELRAADSSSQPKHPTKE
ncbi:MAG: hypothetical protein EBY28_20315 [Betaproteobacteria bacterium]|nr:hypothetical protein [Betaproteobacteria bacterium]